MRKKYRFRSFLPFLVLALGLSGMGAAYARWNDQLTVDGRVTTGVMDFTFHDDRAFSVSLVDENGEPLELADSIEATFHSEGKTAEVTLQLPFTGTYLAGEDACFIRMECPVRSGDQGTIDAIELSSPDLTGESHEEAVLTPASAALRIEDGEYDLPETVGSDYSVPLHFDVYRGVESVDGQPTAVICLSLQDDSRKLLLNLPEELELTEEEFPEASELSGDSSEDGTLLLDASVVVTYQCSLPLYIEQGRQDILHIPEGADDHE